MTTTTAPNWHLLPETMTTAEINGMIDHFLAPAPTAPAVADTTTHPAGNILGDAVLVGNYEDGSPEWHEARKGVIGGSEVAAIAGVPSFKSAYVLWYEKAGYKPQDVISEETQELFDIGHAVEPMMRERFRSLHPEFQIITGGSWVHKDNKFHGANPDALLRGLTGEIEAVLELKYSMRGSGWENGGVPEKYIAQLRWYLACFGFSYGYIMCLCMGQYLRFYVPANPMEPVVNLRTGEQEWYQIGAERMVEAAREWHATLPTAESPGTPPALDGAKDTLGYVMSFHKEIDGSDYQLTPEEAVLWADAREAEKAAEAVVINAKATLLQAMGKAKNAKIDGKTVAQRAAKGGGTPFIKGVGKVYRPTSPSELEEQVTPVEQEEQVTPTEIQVETSVTDDTPIELLVKVRSVL